MTSRGQRVRDALQRLSAQTGVPVDDMLLWLEQHATSDLDRVTNEQLEELRRTVLAWVGGNGTSLKPVAVSPSVPVVPIDKERLRDMLRALILRDATPEQIELVIAICEKYGFDPLLRHIVLISGQIYVTRDGLLHLAHASGQLDGIEVEAERDADGKWVATARVYRKDMQRPFVYSAHQAEHEVPSSKAWQKAPRAMTIKCAEVMALRRAFAVALAGAEEIGYEGEQE
ncbi:recombinase RecT (plasmid) [Thermomicrobium sp. 4228-Ro]|uniref:recombinase RecT n=1 Tax=Thermomicrobium sp. 4228-Ro TaxID=2993937 RepID=UPI0022489676|nr:recombinase RecT [Thermomicrobium sp. 4228-Ro]MCX2728533.1 recombinase RecT [Thermomicrobium sp. 4228-Ro]